VLVICGQVCVMRRVRIILEGKLLRDIDRVARRTKSSRSALMRDALREYLHQLELRAKEEREREAYLRQPQSLEEIGLWESAAVWPEDAEESRG
jgi:metal-responsive CopG/Arc/MetJ family transcriptional regulator